MSNGKFVVDFSFLQKTKITSKTITIERTPSKDINMMVIVSDEIVCDEIVSDGNGIEDVDGEEGEDGEDGEDEGKEGEEYDADATSPIVAYRVGKIKIGDVVGSFFS
jgi:hypothetical protein